MLARAGILILAIVVCGILSGAVLVVIALAAGGVLLSGILIVVFLVVVAFSLALGFLLLVQELLYQLLIEVRIFEIRLLFQCLLIGVYGFFQLAGPGQGVAPVVVTNGTGLIGKGFRGVAVLAITIEC